MNQKIEQQIREIAKDLLQKGEVSLVIGYGEGTMPMRSSPIFVRKPEDVDKLIWTPFCYLNLANYLLNYKSLLDAKKKVAVVAKGCDSRALVVLIQEKQWKRENLVIIGIPCSGIVDTGRIEEEFFPSEITDTISINDHLEIKVDGEIKKLKKEDYIAYHCQECIHPVPLVYDYLIEAIPRKTDGIDPYKRIKDFEAMSEEERWAYFNEQISKCIRCYACRNACFGCYCKECFVDCNRPQWLGTGLHPADVRFFHIIRAFHLAGRCVSCGNCSLACPMGVDIDFMVRKLARDAKLLYDHEAGVDLAIPPALTQAKVDDPNEGFH